MDHISADELNLNGPFNRGLNNEKKRRASAFYVDDETSLLILVRGLCQTIKEGIVPNPVSTPLENLCFDEGIHLETFRSPEEFLVVAEHNKPRLMLYDFGILDINMNPYNGFELALMLKLIGYKNPLLACSGSNLDDLLNYVGHSKYYGRMFQYTQTGIASKSFDNYFNGFLPKPFKTYDETDFHNVILRTLRGEKRIGLEELSV